MNLVIFITNVVVLVTIVILRLHRSAVVAGDLGLLFVDLQRFIAIASLANNVNLPKAGNEKRNQCLLRFIGCQT